MDFLKAIDGLGAKQVKVFSHIIRNMNPSNNTFVGTYKSISKDLGISIPTAQSTYAILLKRGVLFRIARGVYQVELDNLEFVKQLRESRRLKTSCGNICQVNIDNSLMLRKCIDENPRALELFLFMLEHMDSQNTLTCPYKVFQEELGISDRTVSRCIKYLRDNNFLQIYRDSVNNVYVINKDLVCKF